MIVMFTMFLDEDFFHIVRFGLRFLHSLFEISSLPKFSLYTKRVFYSGFCMQDFSFDLFLFLSSLLSLQKKKLESVW